VLRTGFIGSDNLFDKYMCRWLREHSDLRLIIWTDRLRWAAPPGRWAKVVRRYRRRAKHLGWPRVIDEIAFYAVYHTFLRRRDARGVASLLGGEDGLGVEDIRQLRPSDIAFPDVVEAVTGDHLDVLFAMCVDVLLPEELINAPRLGAYLWHEGITPEYRGRYPAFWALANRDYDKLGYTLLRMNMKFDAGEVFVQGTVSDVDPLSDSHVYIGHKAVLDSLPATARFLEALERGDCAPLERAAARDRAYSYPTASAFARIAWDRLRRSSTGDVTPPAPGEETAEAPPPA
jgi:hypothetical protein